MNNDKKLDILRHSCAHLLAMAVKKIFPSAKLAIGPAIENGFYYDFELLRSLTDEDLSLIKKTMKDLSKKNISFEKKSFSLQEAKNKLKNQPYKMELLEDIQDKKIDFYKTGDFIDLCRGPHVESTKEIKYFKLLFVAGAYWRGDSSKPMLQRIYGTCWQNKDDLMRYLKDLEESKKRDHKKLGQTLDLFSFHSEAAGMVFWHPKGKIVFDKLVNFSREKSKKFGYQEISTPNILDVNVWKTSGHWNHYKEAMFFVNSFKEKVDLGVRPMGCPGAIILYKTSVRSYKDLPIRYAEFDTITRNELSGTLHGLFRLRQFTQDDAHIFLREDQISEEISSLLKLVNEVYQTIGFRYKVKLSTRPSDYMGEIAVWNKAEDALKKALIENKINYEIKDGEGAFYGPKIDFDILDAMNRFWQCATIQLDFQMPEKFNLKYIDKKGKMVQPIIIHRVILGSIERFMGILLEHTNGKLPVWLSPIQVRILPVSDKHCSYAAEIVKELEKSKIRADFDFRSESVSKKIRDSELQKIPYIIVVGDKEVKNKNITIRDRSSKELKTFFVKDFIKDFACRNRMV